VFVNPKKRSVCQEKASEVLDQRKQKWCSNLAHEDDHRTHPMRWVFCCPRYSLIRGSN
jgi:hypothetical protein